MVATGLKGKTLEIYSKQLSKCNGDVQKCLQIFANKQKVAAICKCYEMLHNSYEKVSKTWKKAEDLQKLPYIGPATCFELACGIGLQSTAKAD